MSKVTITLNEKKVQAEQGETVLDAATASGVRIPTLCFLKGLDSHASCRMCVVEVEGNRALQPACITRVAEGMIIRTDTPVIRKSRKNTLELLLARHSVDCHHCLRSGMSTAQDLDSSFCEMCFFCDCVRDGFCELQTLAREYGVDALPYDVEPNLYPVDCSTGCVVLNPNKCIKCRRCVDVCANIQTVHALSLINRGSDIRVMPVMGRLLSDSGCVACGRCAQVCPTGAVHMLEQKDEFLYHTHSYETATIAQVSEDVLDELAVLSGMKRWQLGIGHVAAGLKKTGVDYVVTEAVSLSQGQKQAADYISENAVTLDRPVILTSSHSAVEFVRRYFPDLADHVCCYDSAQTRFGENVRNGWSREMKLEPSQTAIRTISISADNGNEGEATKTGSVDFVISPRELYRIFMRTGVNLKKIHRVEPDIFGVPAELAPAMARLLAPVAWGIESVIDELDVELGGKTFKAAVGKTLGHARQLLKQVKDGKNQYQIIKISS